MLQLRLQLFIFNTIQMILTWYVEINSLEALVRKTSNFYAYFRKQNKNSILKPTKLNNRNRKSVQLLKVIDFMPHLSDTLLWKDALCQGPLHLDIMVSFSGVISFLVYHLNAHTPLSQIFHHGFHLIYPSIDLSILTAIKIFICQGFSCTLHCILD